MAIGYHEHMRHVEIGDEMAFKVERLLEAFEINPTRKRKVLLEKAVQELNDFTDEMNKLYGIEPDKKAALW